MQDNYFILLELDFDPIENNEDIILDAINKKVQEWQKDSKNPKKAVLAKSYLQNVEKIKEVMLNDNLRREEALQAKSIQEKKRKDVYYDAVIKATKGYLKVSEVEGIVEKYKEYKITAKDVVRKITVPIYDDNLINVIEGNDDSEFIVTDKSITNQLETYFENIGTDDMSIYEFLYTSSDESLDSLLQITEEKLQFILQKGTKTTYDEITQKIAGIAKNIFASEEEKEKYDNYLSGNRYSVINRLIRDGAENNDNTINASLYKVLISIICNDFGMNQSEATKYISNNIRSNGFSLDKNVLTDTETQKSFSIIFDDKEDSDTIDEYEEFNPDTYEHKKDSRKNALDEFFEDLDRVDNNFDNKQEAPPKPNPQPETQSQPERTTKEDVPPKPFDDNVPITCEYINNVVFPEVSEFMGNARREIYQQENDVLNSINNAVNKSIIPSFGSLKLGLFSLPVCMIINVYFLWIFEYKMQEIFSLVYSVFLAAMAIFLIRIIFYTIRTKKAREAYSVLLEYKARFDEMCKKNWVEIDFNHMPLEDIIPYTEKLKENAEKYRDKTMKQRSTYMVEISKFRRTNTPFYFTIASIASILLTIVMATILLS